MSQPSANEGYAERIYRALLFAYPGAFRRRYGREMAQMFAACYREARRQGQHELARLWLHTIADLLTSAPPQWIEAAASLRALAPLRLALVALLIGMVFELASRQLLS
jgi:hypothetical protein